MTRNGLMWDAVSLRIYSHSLTHLTLMLLFRSATSSTDSKDDIESTMIQLVFVFGVFVPTLITVACFIGFLICWFRFRSVKRSGHVTTDRKSSVAACPRRCRVHVESSSALDLGACGHRTSRCFWPPTGSSIIPAGSRIPDGLSTHRRDSVVLPPTSDVIDIDMPCAATVKVRCPETLIKRPGSRSDNFNRPISGLRSSTTSPGFLLMHQDRRNIFAFSESARTRTIHCLSNVGALKPEVYIATGGSELRKKGKRPWSRAMNVESCYVEVEPTVHAAVDCLTSSRKRPRISVSRSTDDAVSKATLTTTSGGLSYDRKYYSSSGDGVHKSMTSREVPRLPHTRRHHSLTEVPPHHRQLQIKTDDNHTSLDF